jgi:metallo-beta-lactamase family protein
MHPVRGAIKMKATFHGAARTTTGSMHLLEIEGKRVLLDCGMYQGRRKEAFERNRNLPFDPATLDTVILSHAHIDHSGNVPTLVKRGFKGEILATPATVDLCDIMLRDSAYIQTRDVEYVNRKRSKKGQNLFEPLYVPEDMDDVMKHFRGVPYGTEVEVAPGAKMTLNDAGHLLGSANVTIDFKSNGGTKRLLFTGDMGREAMPILRDPVIVKDVDVLITESTYGNRLHPPKADVEGQLKGFVEEIIAKGSRLIIPSFSVGRTQQIVYFLHDIYIKGGIKDVPVFVDSPLSTKATGVYEKHSECYDREISKVFFEGDKPFQFRSLRYTASVEESKKINQIDGPAIIISASGMCEAGRILHHLANNVGDPRNIVLIVGYQAENTLGRRIIEHVTPIKIFGDKYDVRAQVHTINALSAHADKNEMLDYFKKMGPKVEKAFVVHGEEEQTKSFAEALRGIGASDVIVPEKGDEHTF